MTPNQPSAAIFIDCGGPVLEIAVNGRRVRFEDHPYCGPTALKRNGDPARYQPNDFLTAATLWAQQGRKVKNGLCQWNPRAKLIK